MRIRLLVLAVCLAMGMSLAGATASAPASGPNAVIACNANAGEAVIAACFLGGFAPQEARMYAMMHVAVHDALNGIDRRSRPYAANLNAPSGRRRTPQSRQPHVTSSSRCSARSRSSFRRIASMPASRAWKRTTRPRSKDFDRGGEVPGHRRWDSRPRLRFWPCARATATTRRRSTRTSRRARHPASTATRRASPSHPGHIGARSLAVRAEQRFAIPPGPPYTLTQP